MWHLHCVRFVKKCRTVEQQMTIYNKTEMRVSLATKSVSHAWKTVYQEIKLCPFSSFVHPYLFYDKRDGKPKVPKKRSNDFSPYSQLKRYIDEGTLCRREHFFADAILNREEG